MNSESDKKYYIREQFNLGSSVMASRQDVEAFEQMPLTERITANNTYGMLQASARRVPHKTAFCFVPDPMKPAECTEVSYQDLLKKVNQAANLFHQLGVGPGDCVAYLLPSLLETQIVIWGGAAAGIVFGVNFMLEADHIASLLKASKTKVIVTCGASALCPIDIGAKVNQIKAELPELRAVLQVGDVPVAGAQRFEDALASMEENYLISGREIMPEDTACYFHTGGSTGIPKIAPQSHQNDIACVLSSIWGYGLHEDDRFIFGMPLFHTGGVKLGATIPLCLGATIVQIGAQGFRAPQALEMVWPLIEAQKITIFVGVPTVVARLNQLDIGQADISTLRHALIGASALPRSVGEEFEHKTGVKVLEVYGLTEAELGTSANPWAGNHKIGSGGLRLPYIEQVIARIDENGHMQFCETGQVGTILVRGPTVFSGYLGRSNEDIWVEGDWFNTGDLGYCDEDGFFWIVGRQKDVIIRGGHNIDPVEIEDPMHQHQAIENCGAVGLPDADLGEVPVLYVSLKPGEQAQAEEILNFARAKINERAAVPKQIFILEQMPLTAVGKVYKPALRKMAATQALSEKMPEHANRLTVDLHPDLGLAVSINMAGLSSEQISRIAKDIDKLGLALANPDLLN